MNTFEYRKNLVLARYEELVTRPNVAIEGNGLLDAATFETAVFFLLDVN